MTFVDSRATSRPCTCRQEAPGQVCLCHRPTSQPSGVCSRCAAGEHEMIAKREVRVCHAIEALHLAH